jgi:ArsR family transcriptional regulator, virulence genes transcriptional regulator
VVATLAEIFCPPDMKKADDNSTDDTETQGRR